MARLVRLVCSWQACFCLVLVWTVAGTALAIDSADEAELHFEIGAEAYRAGDFRRAVEHFLISNRLSPNPNVTENIARSYERLGRHPEAYRYYQLALTTAVDEAAQRPIREALAQLEAHVVVLDVETVPIGATLYVDRIELGALGETPKRLGLPPGSFRIIAVKSGFRPAEIQLEPLSVGERRSITLTLEARLGRVTASGSQLEGARISTEMGGKSYVCIAPCSLDLPPGLAEITVTRPGYRSAQFTVEVEPEQTQPLVVRLEAATGELAVEADEVGALVEVDGRSAGYTPALLRLPVGKHRVRVSQKGFEPAVREVVIVENEQKRLTLSLEHTEEVTAASRRVERAVDAPSSVTIIPAEELRLFSYPTVLEALRGSPGVFQWDDRAYPSIGIRGQGVLGSYGNRVLLLEDDHAMNESWAGSSYGGYMLRTDLANVERIEIVRGPGSVLYGTNAFAGVVNVVTRDAARSSQTELGAGVAQEGVGRFRARQDVRLGQSSSFWAGVGLAKSAGNSYVIPTPMAGIESSSATVTTAPAADALEAGTLEAHLVHGSLKINGQVTTHEKVVPHGYFGTIVGDLRSRQRDTRGYLEARYEPNLGKRWSSLSRVHGDAYFYEGAFPYQGITPYALGDGGLTVDRFNGLWFGVEQRLRYEILESLALTAGGVGQVHPLADQTAQDETEVYLDERRNVYVGAGYGHLEWTTSRVRLSAGFRYDAYGTTSKGCQSESCTPEGTFGSSVNPRVALVIKPYQGGTSKVMVGKAFRAPSVYELFYNDHGMTQIAAPHLAPEEVWSIGLEHLHQFGRTVQGSINLYATRTTDAIVSGQTLYDADEEDDVPAKYVLQYRNSPAPLGVVGGELRLRREWSQGFMLEISYSLQLARYLASEDLGDFIAFRQRATYEAVANVPAHMGALKGAVPILKRALTLGTRLTIESGRATWQERMADQYIGGPQFYTSPSVVWDIVLHGEDAQTGIMYTFGVYNAFDARYLYPTGQELTPPVLPAQGRSFLADLSVRF